jgi:hypothetical protein
MRISLLRGETHWNRHHPRIGKRRLTMDEKPKVGCARPTGGLVGQAETTEKHHETESVKEERKMIQVGKPAPDFIAPAYYKGEFTAVKLSEHLGKWVVLCLYPGDFTFV